MSENTSGEFKAPLDEPETKVLETIDDKIDTEVVIDLDNPPPAPEVKAEEPKSVDQPVVEKEQAKEVAMTFGEMPVLEFDTDPHNVRIKNPTTSEGEGVFIDSLDLPSAARATQEKLLSKFPNLKDMKNRADVAWAQTFMQSMEMVPAAGVLDQALSREGSDWNQGIEINGELIKSGIPRFKSVSNTELIGEKGLQMAFSHMGMGDFFHAGMWNSGFWVTFKPAPEIVWLNINRILGQDVTGISRQTYGLLHSSATSMAVSTIINSIIPYVYGTSVKNNEMPVSDIPKYLSNHDEINFIWGFICANYPQGVTIDRSCIADPNTCRAVIKETLNMTELQIVDRAALPEENRLHMRSRSLGSMSLESVLKYQQTLLAAGEHIVTLKGSSGKEAKLTLTIPSSATRATMSNGYVADIQDSILSTVTADVPIDQREALYDERMTATELRMFQHWVKKIELSDDLNNAIVDPTTIGSTLGVWTRDPMLREQFFNEVNKFINKTAMSVVGLEAAKCPTCGADHNRPEQKLRGHIDYIPLDLVQVFSYLAEYKTRLISARV